MLGKYHLHTQTNNTKNSFISRYFCVEKERHGFDLTLNFKKLKLAKIV